MTPTALSTTPATPDAALFRPADIAHKAGCHPSTIKAVAESLRLDVARCPDGSRIFSAAQAQKIIAEIARRRAEALRQ